MPLRSFPRPIRRAAAALLLAGFSGCSQPATRPEATASAPPAAAPPETAVEPFEPEVRRLDPREAARLAEEAREQAASVRLAEGLRLDLWAPEALVQDPVAIDFDDEGRLYYTRTNRKKNSEFDIREHRDWMIEVIGLETTEDRRAFLRRTFAPEKSAENSWLPDLNEDGSHDWRDLAVEEEQVYRLRDTDGDGRADEAQLFLQDFHTEVTDVAGGLAVHEGSVYVGVAPDFWRVRDADGDGRADVKRSLSHGWQVHIGFGAHGMSGAIPGPDGRMYWSIGDIGMNVVAPDGRRWAYPHQGVIVRAEPDGSGFEVFAAGLRNTHEFVFDDYGNLISVDNDGDHPGEHERVVYLVDGSDTGWRIHWQFGKYLDPDNNGYKVWMDEGLYKPRFEGQAAFHLPPVAAYNSGPAGMVYNPGTALGERWKGRFFVAEFVGSPRTRISAFRLEPQGAGFRLAGEEEVMQGLLATGLAWGPDGALYFADWVEGWDAKNRGRVWKLDDPAAAASALRAETERLLAENLDARAADDLQPLLAHADQRVRLKAQFALARKGAEGERALLAAARRRDHPLARIHGLWGLGQLARRDARAAAPIAGFLADADPEVRAQAAKLLGDVRHAPAAARLLPLLADRSARVRFFAAEALGRIGHRPAVAPIVRMLEENDDRDVYLRHGGAIALARIGDAASLAALSDHPSRAVRIAAVVALRRLGDAGVARFLEDDDEFVATEAARAVNDDASIEAALPALARMLDQRRFSNEPLLRRAVNANLRLGTAEAAERVARFAARADAPEAMRVEALAALGVWAKPSVLDRVDGRNRGPVERDPAVARGALAGLVEPLLRDPAAPVRIAAAGAAGRLRIAEAAPALHARLRPDAPAEERVAALRALHALGDRQLEGAVRAALADPDAAVRTDALRLLPSLGLPEEAAADMLAAVLERGAVEEQQSALSMVAGLRHPRAVELLERLLARLEAGTLPPEIHLDVLEAGAASGGEGIAGRVNRYRTPQPGAAPVSAFREALQGGSRARGAEVFLRHPAAMCTRCHAVRAMRAQGGDVGPDLSGIGARASREFILESLVDPSAHIAPGYGLVSLTLRDGQAVSGTLREETDAEIVVQTGPEETRRVPKTDVAGRQNVPSSMPPMGQLLSRRELRDLVEFLASLRR